MVKSNSEFLTFTMLSPLGSGGQAHTVCSFVCDSCTLHTFMQRMQRMIQRERVTCTTDAPLEATQPFLGGRHIQNDHAQHSAMSASSPTLRRFPTLYNSEAFFRWLDEVLDDVEGCGFFCAPAPPGD